MYHAEREGQFPPPLFSPKLNGIIAHLTLECNGNVHERGVVNVTGDGRPSPYEPIEAVYLGRDSQYNTTSWICYDFKERRVIPTSDSMTTGPGGHHRKSWVAEVSKDRTENLWKVSDRRNDKNDLTDSYGLANFKISRVPSESFRFLRVRLT